MKNFYLNSKWNSECHCNISSSQSHKLQLVWSKMRISNVDKVFFHVTKKCCHLMINLKVSFFLFALLLLQIKHFQGYWSFAWCFIFDSAPEWIGWKKMRFQAYWLVAGWEASDWRSLNRYLFFQIEGVCWIMRLLFKTFSASAMRIFPFFGFKMFCEIKQTNKCYWFYSISHAFSKIPFHCSVSAVFQSFLVLYLDFYIEFYFNDVWN